MRLITFNLIGKTIIFSLITVFALSSQTIYAKQTHGELKEKVDVWLNRIHSAARTLDYDGTFVYQRGNVVQASRIIHFAKNSDNEYERVENLDGKSRIVLRHNNEVFTFLPESKILVIDKRKAVGLFPALLATDSSQILLAYEAKFPKTDRVAGKECQVIEFSPKDKYRFAHKLWVDKKTGLLLRVQTLGEDNQEILEQITFTQVEVGASADLQENAIEKALKETAGWRIVRLPSHINSLSDDGWKMSSTLPGYKKILSLRRQMPSQEKEGLINSVDQIIFSDGLSAISIFIEPLGFTKKQIGTSRSGATHLLVKKDGNYWVTLIGEVPLAALQAFSDSIK